jgi:hypothetical protein
MVVYCHYGRGIVCPVPWLVGSAEHAAIMFLCGRRKICCLLSRADGRTIVVLVIGPDIAGATLYEVGYGSVGATFSVCTALEHIVLDDNVGSIVGIAAVRLPCRTTTVDTEASSCIVREE